MGNICDLLPLVSSGRWYSRSLFPLINLTNSNSLQNEKSQLRDFSHPCESHPVNLSFVTCFFFTDYFAGNGDVSTKAVTVFPPPEYGPSFKQWKDQIDTATLVEKYYKEVRRIIRDQIRQMYALDFELFGYDKYLPFERNETDSTPWLVTHTSEKTCFFHFVHTSNMRQVTNALLTAICLIICVRIWRTRDFLAFCSNVDNTKRYRKRQSILFLSSQSANGGYQKIFINSMLSLCERLWLVHLVYNDERIKLHCLTRQKFIRCTNVHWLMKTT